MNTGCNLVLFLETFQLPAEAQRVQTPIFLTEFLCCCFRRPEESSRTQPTEIFQQDRVTRSQNTLQRNYLQRQSQRNSLVFVSGAAMIIHSSDVKTTWKSCAKKAAIHLNCGVYCSSYLPVFLLKMGVATTSFSPSHSKLCASLEHLHT